MTVRAVTDENSLDERDARGFAEDVDIEIGFREPEPGDLGDRLHVSEHLCELQSLSNEPTVGLR